MMLTSRSQRRPLRLAYIEDDEAQGRLLQRSWAKDGMVNPLRWYPSPNLWLQMAAAPFADPEDILLVDLSFPPPAISGAEFMRLVRAQPELAHLPLFILTGSDEATAAMIGHQVGAAGWMEKPLTGAGLRAMLIDITRRHPRYGLELVEMDDPHEQEQEQS